MLLKHCSSERPVSVVQDDMFLTAAIQACGLFTQPSKSLAATARTFCAAALPAGAVFLKSKGKSRPVATALRIASAPVDDLARTFKITSRYTHGPPMVGIRVE